MSGIDTEHSSCLHCASALFLFFLLQAAGQDRENALLAARDEAAEQLKAAQDAAAAAAVQLAEVQAAAKAEAERLVGEKQELDKQLKVAQVRGTHWLLQQTSVLAGH